jgi:hypothetical protein
MAERLLHYNVNAMDYHHLPVWSILLGTQRFGTPPAEVVAKIEVISDLALLQKLLLRTLDVTSWAELLA